MDNILFIFVDESGNFDFSPKGTKYFVLSAVTTFDSLGREKLDEIKYEFLKKGLDIEYFHASEDKQIVRDEVFKFIKELQNIEIDSVIVQKNKANPSLYLEQKGKKIKHKGDRIYEIVLRTLLKYIFKRYKLKKDIEEVIVILSSIFTKNKRELISSVVKKSLKRDFPKPFHIYFHDAKSDKNSQISDYCCWAIYVKWERQELRPYNLIKDKIKSEFDIFKRGNGTIYYEYKK